MAADSKAWAHTLKCNHVVPCFEIVFPVGLESFWDLQLSVSTVGMGLAFLQWSLNLWGDSSCAELCCSTSCEETMCWQQQQKSLATTSWHHRRTRSESCCLQSFPTSRAHSSWMSTWFWKHCIWTVCWWIWTCSCASTPKASLILFCGFRASFWFTCCSCLCVFCVLILDMMCVCACHTQSSLLGSWVP